MAISARVREWRAEIALVVCVIVSAGVLVVSETGNQRLQQGYGDAVQSINASSRHVELLSDLLYAETSQRGYLLTRREIYLDPYEDALSRIAQHTADLRKYYMDRGDVEQAQAFGEVVSLLGERLSEMEVTLGMAQQGKWAAATEVLNSDLGVRDMELIRDSIAGLKQLEGERTFARVGGWRDTINLSRVGVALVTALNLVLLLLVFRSLRRDWRQSAQTQEALDRTVRERTAQLEMLATHLQEVSEAEKSRLARDLHDELGAILTASKMDIAWVNGKLPPGSGALAEKLTRAIRNLEQGIQTKRRIVEDLRPTTLVTFGLTTALREYAEQITDQAGWKLELELPDEDPDLPEHDSIALFRIMQESLTNISRYAQASLVRISVTCDKATAKLEVEDNGIGFSPREVRPKAHGLLGIRQRINARGGSLEVRSAPGKGTLVRAILPVHAAVTPEAAPHAGVAPA